MLDLSLKSHANVKVKAIGTNFKKLGTRKKLLRDAMYFISTPNITKIVST